MHVCLWVCMLNEYESQENNAMQYQKKMYHRKCNILEGWNKRKSYEKSVYYQHIANARIQHSSHTHIEKYGYALIFECASATTAPVPATIPVPTVTANEISYRIVWKGHRLLLHTIATTKRSASISFYVDS